MSGVGRIPKKPKTSSPLVVPVVEVDKKEERRVEQKTKPRPASKYKKWDLKRDERETFSHVQLAIWLKKERVESLEDVIGWILANRRLGNWMMDLWYQLVIHLNKDRLARADFDAKSPVMKKLYPIWLDQVVIETCIAENLPDVRFFAILPTMRELWRAKAVRDERELTERFKAQVHNVWATLHNELWNFMMSADSMAKFFAIIDDKELHTEFAGVRWIQKRFDAYFRVYDKYVHMKKNTNNYVFQNLFAPRILPLFPLSMDSVQLNKLFSDIENHEKKNYSLQESLDKLKYVLMQKQEEDKRVVGTKPHLLVQEPPAQINATSTASIAAMRDPRVRSGQVPQQTASSSTMAILLKISADLAKNATDDTSSSMPEQKKEDNDISASAAMAQLREMAKQLL